MGSCIWCKNTIAFHCRKKQKPATFQTRLAFAFNTLFTVKDIQPHKNVLESACSCSYPWLERANTVLEYAVAAGVVLQHLKVDRRRAQEDSFLNSSGISLHFNFHIIHATSLCFASNCQADMFTVDEHS